MSPEKMTLTYNGCPKNNIIIQPLSSQTILAPQYDKGGLVYGAVGYEKS